MKKLPIILLMFSPYAFAWLFLDLFLLSGNLPPVWPLIPAIYLLILFFNMIYAFVLPKLRYSSRKLLFWNMFLKLWNIPIYLSVFLFVLLTHVFSIPLIPFLFLFDYTLLLSSTSYGISGILNGRKGKLLTPKAALVNIILQFLFCFDVFSAVYCYVKARKQGA